MLYEQIRRLSAFRYLIWLAMLLAGSASATTETMLTDYRLFLQADSVWIVRADDGSRVDSAKWSTVTTIDTTFSVPNDTRTVISFFAFGDGYATNGSPTHYIYDNHNTGDTSQATLALASEMAKALDSLGKIIDSLEAQDDWLAHQTTSDSILTGYASMVPSDTNINGDTIATQGEDQEFRLKSLTITNQAGNAVTFTGGVGGGDPVTGHGLALMSNYGDGLRAVSAASGYDINADIQGNLSGNITGDLNGDVTSIANAVITTSAFAAGALNNNVFATDAFTASKFHSDLTGSSGEIGTGVWTFTTRLLSSMVMSLLAGEVTQIADSVWGIENESYGRQLTDFDEDYTTLDLNATTIGTVIGVTNDVNVADADMALIGDTVWNKDFETAFTAGSIGDSVSTAGYVQGSATMTAEEIMDSLFNRLVSDTATGTFMAELFHNAQIGGDSASWADLADVWQNVDTTNTVDTSDIGAWIEAHSGAAAASNWSNDQRDSVLAVIADAGKVGLMLDSIFAIIDTVQNQDDWIAAATNLTLVIDTVNGIIDTIQVYDTRFDSLLAALTDAAIGDKVWIDYATRLLSDGNWTNTQIDSILNTIEDANKANYMADVSALSTFDETSDSVIVDVSSAITAGGLVPKIEDSVHAQAADYKATGFSTHNAANVWGVGTRELTALDEDNTTIDVDGTTVGVATSVTNAVTLTAAERGAIEDSVHAQAADYKATVAGLSTFDVTSDSVIVDVSSALAAGLADSTADEVWDEDTASHNTAATYGIFVKDTSAFQGDASGLSAATIWGYDTSSITTGVGGMLKDTSAYQGAASGLTAGQVADAVWDEDTTGHKTPDQFGYWAIQGGAGADTAAILLMMNAENFAKNTDSLLLKSRAEIANQVADSTKNDSAAYYGTGSDTTAILAALDNNNYMQTTDSALLANRGEIADQVEDSVHANAADYKATGYSSHSAADVWGVGTRQLTHLDEDATLIDLDGSTFGTITTVTNAVTLTAAERGAIEDSVHAQAADYQATGYSTHSALDVYNTFIAGTNEQVFWVNTDNVADAVWDEDSTGHYTAGQMAFEASKTAATALTEDGIADAVWDEIQSGHTSVGTFGANLDVAVSSIAGLAGSGAYTYLVQVLDTGATVDSAVSTGKVYVNNVAQNLSAGPYEAHLSNNGVAAFQLDNGTWVMFITNAGFAPKLDTFTVSGAATDTLMVYRDAGAKTTVAWQLDKPNGLPYAAARVSINLVHMYPDDSVLYVADTSLPAIRSREIMATADDNGLMSTNLWPNTSLAGDSSWYEIFARASSGNNPITRKFKYRVPVSDTTVWMDDLTRWK